MGSEMCIRDRDIRKVDDRLQVMEKKMWTIFGALSVISVLVSPVGQKLIRPLLTNGSNNATVIDTRPVVNEFYSTVRRGTT